MLLSYNDCMLRYGNNHQIEKMIDKNSLFKIESGIYSDDKHVSDLEIITYKYPKAVFTMDSAFYYHGLTDVIPDRFCLATQKDSAKIKDDQIRQYFHRDGKFLPGITYKIYNSIKIRIYDEERMLVELIRNKSKLPFDFYKEVISSYRKRIYDLDTEKIQEYASLFCRCDQIMRSIQLEVM